MDLDGWHRDYSGRKIELGSRDRIAYLSEYIEELLEAIADVANEPSFAESLVTDESTLSFYIFSYSEAEKVDFRKQLSQVLGVEVNPRDSLVDIAKRMAHGG